MNWADSMIKGYREGRKHINLQVEQLGDSHADSIDRTLLNGMQSDMTFIIDWLETGRQPGTYRGVDIRNNYRIQYLEDMDLIPDIRDHISHEREELQLEENQKEVLDELFKILSDRERQCFILHVGQRKSMNEVAKMLGISKSSVQEYITRTKEKVDSVVHCHTKSL